MPQFRPNGAALVVLPSASEVAGSIPTLVKCLSDEHEYFPLSVYILYYCLLYISHQDP